MRSIDPAVQALRDRLSRAPDRPVPPPLREMIQGGWSYREVAAEDRPSGSGAATQDAHQDPGGTRSRRS